jgi:hypothetical protein
MGVILSENDKFIGLHVRDKLREKIRAVAREKSQSVAELVRSILEEYFK